MFVKLKAIKLFLYVEQEVQNLWAGSTNWKLSKSPHGREHGSVAGEDVKELGKFPSSQRQLIPLWQILQKPALVKASQVGRGRRLSGLWAG